MRALGLDPVHDTRRAFDGLLAAMSRPGTVQSVPAPADHAVVATLVDHEVTVATDDGTLRDALSEQGRLDPASPERADIVHGGERPDVDVRDCERGSLVEPSDGATVVYRVETVNTGRTDGTTVVLSVLVSIASRSSRWRCRRRNWQHWPKRSPGIHVVSTRSSRPRTALWRSPGR
jgi:phosphonate C-P lyase system protein PhnH